MKVLDIQQTQKISYCIPTELRDENIKINIKKVSGRIEPQELQSESIALVSFAPSLADTWKQIKKFKHIITCSGAHKFLLEKGLRPKDFKTWRHLDLDPRAYKIDILGTPYMGIEYLIASTIHPNYLEALSGHNVKLWHIFANEEESIILPRGEWKITGGSSVGLRTMTIARFLGYTDFHIFGMDGSFKNGATHTSKHPNPPPIDGFETEYNGKKYLTSPSILYVAKETFHELNQMADVKATFYGEGLVQDMAKDYVPTHTRNTLIAFNSPETISKEYIELNRKLHESNPSYGMGGSKHKDTVLKMMTEDIKSVLDYGAGKRQLQKALGFPIYEYDPAVSEISSPPPAADLVVCTDVLEHIEMDKLPFVLDDLKRVVKQVGFFVISTRKAVKTYANGANTHSIVQGKDWWEKKLKKFFDIGVIVHKEKECELHIVVAPKTVVKPDMETVEKDGFKFKFYTPNDTTKWRVSTLFTKEPITIEWIDSMKKGDVLFDVGANVGSYSVYAGVKGIKVYSFEPEAQNYSMLVKNLQLNGIEPNAYCLAISDEEKIGTLYAGQSDVGGACHSFDEKVGHDLKARETKFTQGCLGYPLDSLVNGVLPMPTHIKIDVDGLEANVIEGALRILDSVKSILVEVNPVLPQHLEMIKTLEKKGFSFDPSQVEKATRKEGPFKGCAEYVFRRRVEKESVFNIPPVISPLPFDHCYVENVFDKGFFNSMVSVLPEKYTEIEKTRGTRGYPNRLTGDMNSKFWRDVIGELMSGELKKTLCSMFFVDPATVIEDVLLIRDNPGYQITPHTDTPHKVITALFYLCGHETARDGTRFYAPKKKGFVCKTGKHYPFDMFDEKIVFPFKPNSLLAFKRTNNSFHGVLPTKGQRDVLLYNLIKKPNGKKI